MQIVDNSPELPLDDPKTIEALKDLTGGTPKAEKQPDVKPTAPASSAEPKAEDTNTDPEETDPEKLKAQIRGLRSELSRRKGNTDKVEALEAQIEDLKTKVQESSKPKSNADWIQKLDDDQLAAKYTDWDDELSDSRARYIRAEERGDNDEMERQGQRILQAKRVLSEFKKETLSRNTRRTEEANAQSRVAESIRSEVNDMYETVSEAFPDFQNEDSELWKAGLKEYQEHPELMARLGPAADMVAAAMAVIRNPNLARGKAAPSGRKEVISKLEGAVKKSLMTGASAPSTQRPFEVNVDSAEGLDNFNKYIDRIKGG